MRKIVLWIHVSLDGFTAGPNGELDWLVEHVVSEEGWDSLNRLVSTVDTVLLGRVNYEGFFNYWPSISKNPSSPKKDAEFSRWLNRVQKIVFSRTLSAAEWENSSLVRSIEHEEITRLKQSRGGDIVILNSASIAQALMRMGLIDKFRINIFPVVLGGGKPLFRDITERASLRLLQAKASDSGVIECIYQMASPR